MPSVISSEIQIQFAKSVVPGMREAYSMGFQSIKESFNVFLSGNKKWITNELYAIEKVLHEQAEKNHELILLSVNKKITDLEKELKLFTYSINQQINYLHDDINALSKCSLQLSDVAKRDEDDCGYDDDDNSNSRKRKNGNNREGKDNNNRGDKNGDNRHKLNNNSSIVELKKNNDYSPQQTNDSSDIIIKGKINHLLSEHEYDQAFTLALSIDIEKNTNAYWILQLCYRFNSNLLSDDSLPINNPALLGICKILCESLTKSNDLSLEDSDFRIKWIHECLMQLDVNHSDLLKTNAFIFIQNMLSHICNFSYYIENKISKLNGNISGSYKNLDLKNSLLLNVDSQKESANNMLCLNESISLHNKNSYSPYGDSMYYLDRSILLIIQDKLFQIRKLLKRMIKNFGKKDNM